MRAWTSMVRAWGLVSLCSATVAWAGADRIPRWDLESDEGTRRSVELLGFGTSGEVGAWPRRIAVPYFQIRYGSEVVGSVKGQTDRIVFDPREYTELTDVLYADLVRRLEREGFEVIPVERVVASEGYRELVARGTDASSDPRGSTASRLEPLPTAYGRPTQIDGLARLNEELGTDAVVALFANFEFCPVDYTMQTGMQGIKPCMRGRLEAPGASLMFVGAPSEEGGTEPAWTSYVEKAWVPYRYQALADPNAPAEGPSRWIYDAALVSRHSATTVGKVSSFQVGAERPSLGGYSEGVRGMFDVGLTLALESFFDANREAMARVGYRRVPRAPAPRTERREPVAAAGGDLAGVDSGLFAEASRAEMRCYRMTGTIETRQGRGATPTRIVKRSVVDSRVVEETLTAIPGVGPEHHVVVYDVDNDAFTLQDRASGLRGRGNFEGPIEEWSAWTSEVVGLEGDSKVTTGVRDGDKAHVITAVRGNDGSVMVTMDQTWTRLDRSTCERQWLDALTVESTVDVPVELSRHPRRR